MGDLDLIMASFEGEISDRFNTANTGLLALINCALRHKISRLKMLV
jgi:hypothetical protein